MKSIQVRFEKTSKKITTQDDAIQENWVEVCKKFNDDVSRICDITNQEDYTGLFECFDDDNTSFFYLVKEDRNLYRVKHRQFFNNLGLKE